MSQDATPPGPGEAFLRRIPISAGYYNPARTPPIEKGAFTPTRDDDDGLSFFLETATPAEVLAHSARSGKVCKVARFLASEIFALGLTLTPDQQPGDLPGHHLVKEINLATYKSTDLQVRQKINELCIELARMANSRLVILDRDVSADPAS